MSLLTSQKWTILEESYEDMTLVEKKEMDRMEDMINKLYERVIYRQDSWRDMMVTETQKIQSLIGLCKIYQKELKKQRESIRKLKTQNEELRNKASIININKKDVDIATEFILSVEAEPELFDEVLLREVDKSDLTESQKRIVKSSMF